MQHSCRQCQAPFEDSDDDVAFRAHLNPVIAGHTFPLPAPTLCVDCRQQRRQGSVNQMTLYKRTCALTGKPIISNFRPDSPYIVYNQKSWWSDEWDNKVYGRDFDFSRPFFEQFHELELSMPHPSLMTAFQYDENADYTNYAGKNKDCYLIFDADQNRDCYYSNSINSCTNCMDCLRARRCELCYGCVDSVTCYGSKFLQDCENCIDSMFLKGCNGCRNCIMCTNLKGKEYYVENKQVSKEEFEQIRASLTSRSSLTMAAERFRQLQLEYPQKYIHAIQSEDVTGDYLVGCKNAFHCFDSESLWDCRYCFQAFMPLKDSMDTEQGGDAERLYECSNSGYQMQNEYFCHSGLESHDCYYSTFCFNSHDLFGCCGLKHAQYCIFNKQYTKEEYEVLVSKIIAHMQSTHEWGEFFPVSMSRFPYNETLAQDWSPLSSEELQARDWPWSKDELAEKVQTYAIPDDIRNVQDDILTQTLVCTKTGKAYKIIEQELIFYRIHQLPVPEMCFPARFRNRLDMRNPRHLHDRQCMKCQKPIQTTYAPDRPEIVYCESCYLETVY